MSKVVKSVGKAVGGLLSGVKKVFKSITKSSIGRTLLIAGTVFLGGAALGMWESPFSSINGLFKTGPAAGELAAAAGDTATATATAFNAPQNVSAAGSLVDTGASAAAGGAAPGSSSMFAPSVASPVAGFPQGGSGSLIDSVAGGGAQSGVMDFSAAQGIAQTTPGLAPGMTSAWDVAAAAKPKSFTDKIMDFYKGDFAKAALMTQVGGAIQGAFAPTPEELAEAQFNARLKYDRATRADRNANFNVGGIKIGQPGLINKNVA